MPSEMIMQVFGPEPTVYRVRPNPDVAPDESGGVVLEWSDTGGKKWEGYFYLPPDLADEIADAIKAANNQRWPIK